MSADGEQGGVTTYDVIRNVEDGTWDVVARPDDTCVASFVFEDGAWDYAIHFGPLALALAKHPTSPEDAA